MTPEKLLQALEALPGAQARPTNHAATGYDLEVELPVDALLTAVTIMDGAGYFLEGLAGVDWLGEQETLRAQARAAAREASPQTPPTTEPGRETDSGEPSRVLADESAEEYPHKEDELEVIYDFNRFEVRHRVVLRVRTPRSAPNVPTVQDIYPIAHWYEREAHEFFGVVFTGHPYLVPLLLPEDADYHPLLKDYGA